MKIQIKYCILLLLLTTGINLNSQSYTIKNGLADNSVTKIFQDSYGFMWIGTQNGLSRFDGNEFINFFYKSGDSLCLSDNSVTDIIEDNEGNLWISTFKGLNKYIRKEQRFKQYLGDKNNPKKLSNSAVFDLELINNELFMSSWDGISILDTKKNIFQNYKLNHPDNWYTAGDLIAINNQNIFLATKKSDLYKFDIEKKEYKKIELYDNSGNILSNYKVVSLEFLNSSTLLIGTNNIGLHSYDLISKKNKHIKSVGKIKCDKAYDITIDKNYLYLSTGSQIILTSKQDFLNSNINAESLFNERIFTKEIFLSNDGLIWISFSNKGLIVMKATNSFQIFSPNEWIKQNTLISDISQKDNNIWIHSGSTPFFYNTLNFPKEKKSATLPLSKEIIKSSIVFQNSDNNYWVGRSDIVYKTDQNLNILKKYKLNMVDKVDLCCIKETTNGNLFILSTKQLFILNNKNDTFEDVSLKDLPGTISYIHFNNSSDIIWYKCYHHFGYIDLNKKVCRSFLTRTIPNLPEIHTINYILPISDSNIYIGFNRGLYKVRFLNEIKAEHIQSLGNYTISGLQIDKNLNLWVSTINGIYILNKENEIYRKIYKEHGTATDDFIKGASWKLDDGRILFSANDQLVLINPEEYFEKIKDIEIPLRITSINVSGNKDNEKYKISKPAYLLNEIEIPNKFKTIDIKFSLLEYIHPEKVVYSYRLKGLDHEWKDLSNNRNLTFSYLSPGQYELEIKAVTSNGIEQKKTIFLKMNILPPWYATLWFKILLGIIILIGFYIIYLYRIKSIKKYNKKLEKEVKERTQEIEMQKEELSVQADNLKEVNILLKDRQEKIESASEEIGKANNELEKLNATKDKFFSIIAHDLKNPFMGIMNFSEILTDKYWEMPDDKKLEFMTMVKDSSKSAYQLLENLLQWSRSQTNKIKFEPQLFKLYALIESTFNVLKLNADNKSIKLNSDISKETVAFADKNMITTVIRNIVNNAIKFTPEKGTITVSSKSKNNTIDISISDNGVGMTKEIIDKLFKIDTQHSTTGTSGEPGTGLGLIICKEFIDKNNGTIKVESELGKGSSFIISLPVKNDAFIEKTSAEISNELITSNEEEILDPDDEIYTEIDDSPYKGNSILIIEDTQSIRESLIVCLQENYKILIAENGKQGLEIALEELPDMIISDVMMPKMDGFELVEKIKKDELTSHIPIILLTARTSDASQIKGLESGIDDYLLKPFRPKVLRTRIKNIFFNRQKLRERFAVELAIEPKEVTTTSADEKFLIKAINIVEKNIENPDLSVEVFVKEIGMSRTQLYRKMSQVTGQSISEFVRIIRIKRAAKLLKNPDLNISDVAFKVGFKELQTFTRTFKKQFGLPPSEWLKNK